MKDVQEPSNVIFEFLQGQAPEVNKLTVRSTGTSTRYGEVAHAIDGRGNFTLLVPVGPRDEESIDWQNRLVSFGYRTIRVQGSPQTFLALQCLSDRVSTQFCLLADDILDAVSVNPEDADRVTKETVGRWRDLLREDRPRLLSKSQLAGLYGELLFLEELVFHHGDRALKSWTGPLGNRHDFEFANASFEVKTTAQNNGMVVSFHGVRQLQATEDLPLYVVAYQVERTPQGETIPAVLQRLYSSGLNRLELLSLLETVGYCEADSGHYASDRFGVLATKTIPIGPTFPRITHETVTMPGILDGIVALEYSVDLSPFQPVDVSLEDLKEAGK